MKMSKPTNRLGEGDYSEQTQRYRWFNEHTNECVHEDRILFIVFIHASTIFATGAQEFSGSFSCFKWQFEGFRGFSAIKRSAGVIDRLTNLCVLHSLFENAKLTDLIWSFTRSLTLIDNRHFRMIHRHEYIFQYAPYLTYFRSTLRRNKVWESASKFDRLVTRLFGMQRFTRRHADFIFVVAA